MLLTNGRVHTMDPMGAVVDTLVVRDGRIVFCGRRGEVNAQEPIKDITPVLTMVGGQVVFRRDT
jgi:predicted amidohydrolase YtcJ